jgi:diaminopimelate decarboxylase
LYDAYHRIENLCSDKADEVYDVVGPVCESSDVFCHDRKMPATERGDLLVMRSAGAYGEAMSFGYNCRALPQSLLSTDVK